VKTILHLRLPPDPEAAGAARHALDRLQGRLRPELLEDVRLLVSELVTNSVRHARLNPDGWITLRVDASASSLRIDVIDPGPGFEVRSVEPSIYQTSGWGLFLVDRIADRWGVERGKLTRVWFELGYEGVQQDTTMTPSSTA
jgi:anti-sigma regulatory factor (Ser/Thr protein kinase)